MFERYKTSIEDYCKEMGIDIPIGFERHAAGRFVAIDLEHSPPRLVAATWSKEHEAVDYLVSLAADRNTRLLDFKERRELTFNGKKSLLRGAPF
ncbi:MAG: hypothetical protein ABJA77_02240 [Variovorax sp.]